MKCPHCGKQTGLPIEEFNQGEEIAHLPEGLAGETAVQCQDLDCCHEWRTVSHRQILQSLRLWNAPAPKMT